MTQVILPVQTEIVLRQVNSPSKVLGKLLYMDENGINRFGLIIEGEDGSREGAIYRVETTWDDDSKLFRDHKADMDASDPTLNGAPIYKWADLGNNFWLERF